MLSPTKHLAVTKYFIYLYFLLRSNFYPAASNWPPFSKANFTPSYRCVKVVFTGSMRFSTSYWLVAGFLAALPGFFLLMLLLFMIFWLIFAAYLLFLAASTSASLTISLVRTLRMISFTSSMSSHFHFFFKASKSQYLPTTLSSPRALESLIEVA